MDKGKRRMIKTRAMKSVVGVKGTKLLKMKPKILK
jgi:hypothetical protein